MSTSDNVPKFPSDGRMPLGDITLEDVEFPGLQCTVPLMPSRLASTYRAGMLTLNDTSKVDPFDRNHLPANSVLWVGTVDTAEFNFDTKAGLHTLKDINGTEIWSNAAETPPADLLYERDAAGQARLTDKTGKLLWSGFSDPSLSKISSVQGHDDRYTIRAGGIQVEGHAADVVVKDSSGAHVWSGTLPIRPVWLLRDDGRFVFRSWLRYESGFEHFINLRFRAALGTVTIADRNFTTLGTRPIDLLQIITTFGRSVDDAVGLEEAPACEPHRYDVPKPVLAVDGTVFLTYRENSGRIICRAKCFREGKGQGFSRRG